MDAPSVPGRSKRAVRIELESECFERVEIAAEERSTTAPLLIAMLVREQFPPVEPAAC